MYENRSVHDVLDETAALKHGLQSIPYKVGTGLCAMFHEGPLPHTKAACERSMWSDHGSQHKFHGCNMPLHWWWLQAKIIILDCSQFKERHTSANLADYFWRISVEWAITDKVVVCVSDNASNIKMPRLAEKMFPVNLFVKKRVWYLFTKLCQTFQKMSTASQWH